MEAMAVPKEAGKVCLDLDASMDVEEMHAQLCTLGEVNPRQHSCGCT